ncbi:MAG TPA: ABC transporter ATP-binding protein [Candidatus Baltobacteraceae bacterium]|jgi:iron complex transport system ATP-binding protein|nr:ABC transporter ATP-binding protein [Candidatus Baltobacteraceae bacterium]
MIAVRDVTLAIENRVLLEHMHFEVERGEVLAVLGANGAGKTTLLRSLAGIHPAQGSITIQGREVADLAATQRARTIAHVAADDLLIERLDVREVVAMGRYAHHRWWQWREERSDDAAIEMALAAVGMHAFERRRFETLSSGERQRVWIAVALAQEASILLLDEPTSHLDVRVARDILKLLRLQASLGKSVICALHDINEAAEFADRVVLLGMRAVLAADTPKHVLTAPLLECAYGIAAEQIIMPDGTFRVYATDAATTDPRCPEGECRAN